MLAPTLVTLVLALVLVGIGLARGSGQHVAGLRAAGTMLMQTLPLLVCAFVVAGMVQALVPQESVSRWIGRESGAKGIIVGCIAGGLAPGGPYVSLPIAVGLVKAGAGVGTMVSFLTAWSLWAFARLPMEIGILGWRLTLVRLSCTFLFPPIAGLIAHVLFGKSAT